MPSNELAATLRSAGIEPGSEAWETCVSLETDKQEAVRYLTGGELYNDLLAGMGTLVGMKEIKQLKKVLDHAYSIRAFNAIVTVLGGKVPSTASTLVTPSAAPTDQMRWICQCPGDRTIPMVQDYCPDCSTYRIGQPTVTVGIAKIKPAADEPGPDTPVPQTGYGRTDRAPNKPVGPLAPRERFWCCRCGVPRDRNLSGKSCPICGVYEAASEKLPWPMPRISGFTDAHLRTLKQDPYALVLTKRSPKGYWTHILDAGVKVPDPKLKELVASIAAEWSFELLVTEYRVSRQEIARIQFQYRRYIGELRKLPEGAPRFEYLRKVFGKGK